MQVRAVEVGYRGFPAWSVITLFKDIGLRGRKRMKATRKVGDAAEKGEQVDLEA